VKEIKKAVLVIVVALMVAAMLATSVGAASSKKIPVTMDVILTGGTPPEEFGVTAGNVLLIRGDTLTALWSIGDGDGISLAGTTSEVGILNANLNNPGGTATVIMFGMFPVVGQLGTGIRCWHIVFDLGGGNTFEGNLNSRGVQWVVTEEGEWQGFSILWDGVQHAVLQGKGDYQGWTLVWETLRVDGVDASKDAYMLIP